ncbi:MAG: LysE family translocator [Pseudomonadota bacterium]
METLLPHLPGLLAALGIFGLGFLVIGPNIAAIMATSMHHGRRRGLAMALGVALGTSLWATLTVAGFATLITAYAGAVIALKVFGVAFLLWLAVKAFRSAGRADTPSLPVRHGQRGGFTLGLMVQMTNPKAALQWIAIAAVAMAGDAPWQVGIALIVSATLLSLIGHGAYALIFSTDIVVAAYARARRWIDATLGVLFTYFAYRLATERT